MLELFRIFNLQLFADGGADGSTSDGNAEDNAGEIEIPSSIPARAREIYKKAAAKNRPVKAEAETVEEIPPQEETKAHIPYSDLIKSEEYRKEHQEYMQQTISDRLKKFNGLEETSKKQSALLNLVAQKYGLNPETEGFMDKLAKSIEDDDSYYEDYAMKHDMSPSEARKVVSLERKLAEHEREKQLAEQQERNNRINRIIIENAEKCKAHFPNFDLDTEWKNPAFRQIAMSTNWDIEAAYKTTHWNDIVPQAIQYAQQTATAQTTNAIKANKSRPIENGLGNSSPATLTKPDYSKMTLDQIRAQADAWRRGKK